MGDYERGYDDGLDDGRQALRDYRRSLIEECAGLAVVATLYGHITRATRIPDPAEPRIPIAPAPPSLAEDVAEYLTRNPSHCAYCHGHGLCISHPKPPPFAAAYSDTPAGRRYWLASADCEACAGTGDDPIVTKTEDDGYLLPALCGHCNGTGARTDCSAIARRYGGDGTARSASFEVTR